MMSGSQWLDAALLCGDGQRTSFADDRTVGATGPNR
jgi:hypothetical protein